MDTKRLFGRRLRSLRTSKELTQQELGERAMVGYKYIGSIERGLENPSLEIMAKLAAALDVELTDLFQFDHETTDPNELKVLIDGLLKQAAIADLQLAAKLLRAILY